jgi:hypothetical protein
MTGPYPYSASLEVISGILFDKIKTNKDLFVVPVARVYYGDQLRIPATPTVCIEPSNRVRNLEGVPNMTRNEFEIFILIYCNRVIDTSSNRRDADRLSYDIEHFLHQDLQLLNGGTVPNLIHGFVRNNESGYTVKDNTLYRSARLTYFGLNKTSLPVS